MKKYYITTPLYYVNAKPHIGHAYTNILCDTFARFRRLLGQDVFFMTGTDEHGTKIDKAARELGTEPKTYADKMVPEFKKLWDILNIQYDYFIRTTDADHKKIVQHILSELEKKGDIYKASYKGWYCTPCESFWTKLQLVEGKCPDCKRDVQELSEDNYFFKLSQHQEWLIKYISDDKTNFIRPEMRRNEILGFLREPLEDLCITRPRARLSWGIDFPSSKDHVVYVWFDALINYISGAGYSQDEKKFKQLWPADVHVVGKDILRHHAVYWPIMLKAIGVDMPACVLAHGWWTMAGAKVSKSRGNAVDPIELTQKYGVDAFRYFLLREVTLGLDGAFSEDLLAERYTSDLANGLGNLWFRVASMIDKYCDGKIPPGSRFEDSSGREFSVSMVWPKVREAMLEYNPRIALDEIWKVITDANRYVEDKKPWELAKDTSNIKALEVVLATLAEMLAHIAILLLPFLPSTAEKILTGLQLDPKKKWIVNENFPKFPLVTAGTLIKRGNALFPRLEEEKKV